MKGKARSKGKLRSRKKKKKHQQFSCEIKIPMCKKKIHNGCKRCPSLAVCKSLWHTCARKWAWVLKAALLLNNSKLETNQMSIREMDKDILYECHCIMLFNHRNARNIAIAD